MKMFHGYFIKNVTRLTSVLPIAPFLGLRASLISDAIELAVLFQEVCSLLDSTRVDATVGNKRFYSTLFLVQKNTGSFHPILDFRWLN